MSHDVIFAIGPLAVLGIAGAAKSLLGGGGKKQPAQSPAFTALMELRKRREMEIEEAKRRAGLIEEPGLQGGLAKFFGNWMG